MTDGGPYDDFGAEIGLLRAELARDARPSLSESDVEINSTLLGDNEILDAVGPELIATRPGIYWI